MRISLILLFLVSFGYGNAQNVSIDNYSINNFGQVELQIEGKADKYYLLSTKHVPNTEYTTITSMTMGVDGTMIISEPLAAYPLENYTITEHSIADPDDTDGDGVDDVTEFNNMPTDAPLNHSSAIPFVDGTTSIDNAETFESLAVVTEEVFWAPFLNNQQFVKFGILDPDTENPRVYFINSNTHFIHADFFATVGFFGDDDISGEIVYNPNEILPNGVIGSYSFNFSFGDAENFELTQRTFELLAANMPFLRNNLQHFIGSAEEGIYNSIHKPDFEGSRINVVLESDVFSDIDYIPFHQAEGYGYFRQMSLNESPGSRDIVLYDALPNSLPRVGGIITSVIQTPLSHVNLRAIQDNVPNAYIKDPLNNPAIAELLNGYIYFKVEEGSYTIREATLDEVNEWYEKLRPTEPQVPERDLSFEKILPLDSIKFEMSTSFGAKCSNVATMRTFDLPEGTIPNGYGIPFYFYDEFMKFNNFYDRVEVMLADPTFITDIDTRIDVLKDFRKDIKDADMPQWMLDELQAMHDMFPEGTSVRCRSSTNNEDLPGFSGAGLYTSKTQHPEEGHISKSVKQVYASMWNFRAFEERDFFRVDQYVAAMGILCHPNFEEEKSNGVGVSLDPIYNTVETFYLNTQVGESLITNPDANSVPEELILYEDPDQGYYVVRESNLVQNGELVMGEEYLNQMRDYLKVIHDEFEILYDVVGAEGFGMDIEYKVTAEDKLIIKQARPWVSFWSEIKADFDIGVTEIKDPQNSASLSAEELVTVNISNTGLTDVSDFDISLFVEGELIETLTITESLRKFTDADFQFSTPQDFSELGDHNLTIAVSHPEDGYSQNDTLNIVLTKLHLLEGGVKSLYTSVLCDESIEVEALIANFGQSTIEDLTLEVQVNGLVVDEVLRNVFIPYTSELAVRFIVDENLVTDENEILVRLVSVNGEADAVEANNENSVLTDLEVDSEVVRLILTPDDYPAESSFDIVDQLTNEIIYAGDFVDNLGNLITTHEFCVKFSTCYTLRFYDSIGDGICCSYGNGNYTLLDSDGDVLVFNNGIFQTITQDDFCINSGITSTENLAVIDEVKVYPNPVSDQLTVEFGNRFNGTNDIIIEVYDHLGRILNSYDTKFVRGPLNVPFIDYSSGMYLVKVRNDKYQQTMKVIKN